MVDKNRILHHYTSGNGLIGIIDSDSVWATQIHYLNDAKEFGHAIDQARNYLHHISRNSADLTQKALCQGLSESIEGIGQLSVYVACFSEMEDSLSQWRGYCPPGFGYSIGLIAEELSRVAEPQGFELIQCIYDDAQQWQLVETWAQNALQNLRASLAPDADATTHAKAEAHNFFASFTKFAPALKNGAFRDECEWRLVALVHSTDPRVRLRAVRSMLAPYLPVRLGMQTNDKLVWDLRVGPTPHRDLATLALTHYFGKLKMRNGVGHSIASFRDW